MSEDKRAVGRPSKLGESLEKAKEYLLGGYENVGEIIPSIAGLACYLAISRSTVYEYQKENKEFSDILEAVLSLQESKLINKGLSGDFNPTVTKLILTKHGYSDKQEVDLSSSDGSMRPTTIQLVAPEYDGSEN